MARSRDSQVLGLSMTLLGTPSVPAEPACSRWWRAGEVFFGLKEVLHSA